MLENVDYELVPQGEDDNDTWNIRILTGDFVESVIQFGTLRLDGEYLKFDFELINSPDDDLTEQNEDLQSVAKEILLDLFKE